MNQKAFLNPRVIVVLVRVIVIEPSNKTAKGTLDYDYEHEHRCAEHKDAGHLTAGSPLQLFRPPLSATKPEASRVVRWEATVGHWT